MRMISKMAGLCAAGLLLSFHTVTAQSLVKVKKMPVHNKPRSSGYTYVDQMPEFRGNVYEWLSGHVRYPETARRKGIEGRVIVDFVVNKKGMIEQARVDKSSGNSLLDEEALRVVRSMPLWKPGLKNGVAAKVSYKLPITFKLE